MTRSGHAVGVLPEHFTIPGETPDVLIPIGFHVSLALVLLVGAGLFGVRSDETAPVSLPALEVAGVHG